MRCTLMIKTIAISCFCFYCACSDVDPGITVFFAVEASMAGDVAEISGAVSSYYRDDFLVDCAYSSGEVFVALTPQAEAGVERLEYFEVTLPDALLQQAEVVFRLDQEMFRSDSESLCIGSSFATLAFPGEDDDDYHGDILGSCHVMSASGETVDLLYSISISNCPVRGL